mmetsp:Transcript_56124/g.131399  ORF Transcript_56124/g.131399 Transcript_56124/m.131399 type:complete len:357 (-) Transcript_56124:52-1122(-)
MGNAPALQACFLSELALVEGVIRKEGPVTPKKDVEYIGDPFYSQDVVLQRQAEAGILHNSLVKEVEHISLGNYCMLSLALKAIGLRKCSYPLDYTRCSSRGVIQLFRSQFAEFLTGTPVPHEDHGVTFHNTAWGGSFWHHDISKPDVSQAMQRRVDRLLGHAEIPSFHPRQFYRTVNSTDELDLTFDLYNVLRRYYSGPVKLVTFVELQDGEGPIGLRNGGNEVLFYRIHHQHTMTDSQAVRINGFFQPIAFAIRYFAGETLPLQEVDSLPEVKAMCDVIEGGNPAVGLFAPSLIAQARSRGPGTTSKSVPPMLGYSSTPAAPDEANHSLFREVTACIDANGFDMYEAEVSTAVSR